MADLVKDGDACGHVTWTGTPEEWICNFNRENLNGKGRLQDLKVRNNLEDKDAEGRKY